MQPNPSGAPIVNADGSTNFEEKFKQEGEPWDYDKRAVEILRHEFVVQTAWALKPQGFARVLDIGCAMGQLTSRLNGLAPDVHAIDLSATAVQRAEARVNQMLAQWRAHNPGKPDPSKFHFAAASATQMPFAEGTFDLVLLADGLEGWELSPELKQAVLKDVHRVLQPGGYAILTDYLKPSRFDEFVQTVTQSPLKLVQRHYMNDRLCYQFITWFKAFENTGFVKSMVASVPLARALRGISSLFGRNGSKHFCLVAQKA
jgi:SAM-dependent methyltransferase